MREDPLSCDSDYARSRRHSDTWFGQAYRQGFAEGYRWAVAAGVLKASRRALDIVVEARGLTLAADDRAYVDACCDPDQFLEWLRRAATAKQADDIVGPRRP